MVDSVTPSTPASRFAARLEQLHQYTVQAWLMTGLCLERLLAWNTTDDDPLILFGQSDDITAGTLASFAATTTLLLGKPLVDEQRQVAMLLDAHGAVAAYYCRGESTMGEPGFDLVRSVGVWPAQSVVFVACTRSLPDGAVYRLPWVPHHPLMMAEFWTTWMTVLLPDIAHHQR